MYISKVLVYIFGGSILMRFMICKIYMSKVLIVYFCKYDLEKKPLLIKNNEYWMNEYNMNRILMGKNDLPEWMTDGRTVLCQKDPQ